MSIKIEHKIILGIENKWCSYKKHWIPVGDFGINKNTYDGLSNYCKKCRREYTRLQYNIDKRNPHTNEKRKRNFSEIYQKIKKSFVHMYGEKCVCCGENNIKFLTIEHKQGQAGKKDKHRGNAAYRDALRIFQPDTYEILCYNCNFGKSHYGVCPHKLYTP